MDDDDDMKSASDDEDRVEREVAVRMPVRARLRVVHYGERRNHLSWRGNTMLVTGKIPRRRR